MIYILSFIFGFLILFILFLLFRNEWVFGYQMILLNKIKIWDNDFEEKMDELKSLPSYSRMLFQIHKWDYSEYHPSLQKPNSMIKCFTYRWSKNEN